MEAPVLIMLLLTFCIILSFEAREQERKLNSSRLYKSKLSLGNHENDTENKENELELKDNGTRAENTNITYSLPYGRKIEIDNGTDSEKDLNSYFDIKVAVRMGVHFQSEFCSFFCNGDSKTTPSCLLSYPSCEACSCHDNCHKYGDCCHGMCSFKENNKLHHGQQQFSRINNQGQDFHCFLYNLRDAAKIIASCPDKTATNDKFSTLGSSYSQSMRKRYDQINNKKRYQCEQCLSSPRTISLVTSIVTGLTYCNHACLLCNEPSLGTSQEKLYWQKETSCTEIQVIQTPNKEKSSEHIKDIESNESYRITLSIVDKKSTDRPVVEQIRKINDGADNRDYNSIYGYIKTDFENGIVRNTNTSFASQTCTTQFSPPSSVNVHHCFYPQGRREVSDCDPRTFNTSLDEETFARLLSLCRDGYRWPVYTDDVWYTNIFCFLCQNETPLGCMNNAVYHDAASWTPITEFTLATLTDVTSDDEESADLEQDDFYDSQDGDDDEFNARLRDGGPIDLSRLDRFICPDGFWDSFLSSDCIPVLCSKGRILQTVRHDSNSEFFCVPENEMEEDGDGEEKQKENKEKESRSQTLLYVVDVWWLWDSKLLDYDRKNGVNSFNDDISEPGDDDNVIYGDSGERQNDTGDYFVVNNEDKLVTKINKRDIVSGKRNVSCHGMSKLNYILLNIRREELGDSNWRDQISLCERSAHHQDNTTPLVLEDEQQSILKVLINDTMAKLFSLNISEFMMKISTKYQLKGSIYKARKLSYYFIMKETEKRDFVEKCIIDMFSENKTISHQGRQIFFQSALSAPKAKPDGVHDEEFYMCKEKTPNCCSQINSGQFAYLLHKMKCSIPDSNVIHLNTVSRCPYVVLNDSSFNDTLEFQITHKEIPLRLNRQEFHYSKNNALLVCVNSLDIIRKQMGSRKSPIARTRSVSWDYVLTIICLPVSMLCLLLTFITYLVFPILRTKPAQNNMCLIFWLFLAQAVVLLNPLTPRDTALCKIIAMVLHYVWLSALGWMCACSFHMFLVFVVRRAALGPCRSHRWYLVRYAFFCNALPAVFVLGIMSTVHFFYDDTAGYGGKYCYLYPRLLAALTFVLPQAIIIVINTVLFIMTAVTISRIDDIKRQAGRERHNTRVYLSLSSLTGLTWILAMVSLIPSCRAFRYVSILINGSQGITIFLCYACNRRARKMWMGLIGARGSGHKAAIYTRSSSSRTGTVSFNV